MEWIPTPPSTYSAQTACKYAHARCTKGCTFVPLLGSIGTPPLSLVSRSFSFCLSIFSSLFLARADQRSEGLSFASWWWFLLSRGSFLPR